jgi:asparagine synthetase B (glutamine-hydrolysing)
VSAILGVFDSKGQLPSDASVRAIIARMETRGRDRVQVWRGDGAVLAVARHAWECAPGFSGDALVVEDDRFVVAADASLYYQSDLRQKLADGGVRVAGSTPSHLILAACRAWGAECAAALEGDFAFVAYDRTRRSVIAARDFAGRRPLFYMESGGTLVLASAVAGVTAFPTYREELNLRAVGAVAAGLLGASRESAYRGVHALRAGERLTRVDGGSIELAAHWEPPVYERVSGLGFDEAADQLRELICRATAERFAEQGPTSVWMSGGWDSTAVFAAGEEVHRRRGDGEHLKVVSISYPKAILGVRTSSSSTSRATGAVRCTGSTSTTCRSSTVWPSGPGVATIRWRTSTRTGTVRSTRRARSSARTSHSTEWAATGCSRCRPCTSPTCSARGGGRRSPANGARSASA